MTRPFPLALCAALRPRQWIKNGFVLAPLVFSGNLLNPEASARALWAAAALCLASSAGYLLNDVLDREADRLHPIRRQRPVAEGLVTPRTALLIAVALAAGGLATAVALSPPVGVTVAVYLVLTSLYSLGLKLLPVADVATLAAGFGLRLLAGAAAVPVVPSRWLLTCGVLLALLLALGKRVPEPGSPPRRGATYPPRVLMPALHGLAAVTVLAYAAYTLAPEVVDRAGGPWLLGTVPLVAGGVARYLTLVRRNGGQDPSALLCGDRPMQAVALAWVTSATALATWSAHPPP